MYLNGIPSFAYDSVMNSRQDLFEVSKADSSFLPRVEAWLAKFKDDKPIRTKFRRACERGYKYIDVIMGRHAAQWECYKQMRILNPANLAELDHDVRKYDALKLPIDHPEFMAEIRGFLTEKPSKTFV